MGLEDQGGNLFLACRGGTDDDDVAGRVRLADKAVIGSELLQKGGHGRFVSGFARDAGNFLEVLEYRGRVNHDCRYLIM